MGGRYVDERIATFTGPETSPNPAGQYYLEGNTFGVIGIGNADGTLRRRLSYSPMGDFNGQRKFDADGDGDVDLADFMIMQTKVGATDPGALQVFDSGHVPIGTIDVYDLNAFGECMNGAGVAPPPGCAGTSDTGPGTSPRTGDFAMHGRWIDVLPDGKVLMEWRARTYDPRHGRFLQRDPLGYMDGSDLYGAFRGNGWMPGGDRIRKGGVCPCGVGKIRGIGPV